MKTIEKVAEAKKSISSDEPRLICFVCTGNTCRSPMAEAFLNHRARVPELCSALGERSDLRAISRGLYAMGAPIAENAVAVLEEAGIPSLPDNPYREHISKTIDDETAEAADLIVGMTDSHVFSLLSLYPQFASKITRMPLSVSDPFGGDMDAYRACLTDISRGIDILFFGGDES